MNLLLLAAGSLLLVIIGVLFGRFYAPDRAPLRRAAAEGRSYVRGLVEHLEGKDDAAIAEITAALKSNTKTVEAYFALGTLFRNRGEHERAVRVHQTILVRRDIDKRTRQRVHFQLALDFKAAGFPRRAVKALEWVIAHDRKHVDALRALGGLYEEVGAWERAAAVQIKLSKLLAGKDAERARAHTAHLFAQAAHEALDRDRLKNARSLVRRAMGAAPHALHVLHVLALYEQRAAKPQAAAEAWREALRRGPDLARFFVPRLEAVLFELGRMTELERLLDELIAAHPANVHLQLERARFDTKRNPQRALAGLMELLAEHPHLLPARREAAKLVLQHGEPEEIRSAFEELLAVLARADHGFRCGSCGHAAGEIFWRCPACASWGSVGVAWGRRATERA